MIKNLNELTNKIKNSLDEHDILIILSPPFNSIDELLVEIEKQYYIVKVSLIDNFTSCTGELNLIVKHILNDLNKIEVSDKTGIESIFQEVSKYKLKLSTINELIRTLIETYGTEVPLRRIDKKILIILDNFTRLKPILIDLKELILAIKSLIESLVRNTCKIILTSKLTSRMDIYGVQKLEYPKVVVVPEVDFEKFSKICEECNLPIEKSQTYKYVQYSPSIVNAVIEISSRLENINELLRKVDERVEKLINKNVNNSLINDLSKILGVDTYRVLNIYTSTYTLLSVFLDNLGRDFQLLSALQTLPKSWISNVEIINHACLVENDFAKLKTNYLVIHDLPHLATVLNDEEVIDNFKKLIHDIAHARVVSKVLKLMVKNYLDLLQTYVMYLDRNTLVKSISQVMNMLVNCDLSIDEILASKIILNRFMNVVGGLDTFIELLSPIDVLSFAKYTESLHTTLLSLGTILDVNAIGMEMNYLEKVISRSNIDEVKYWSVRTYIQLIPLIGYLLPHVDSNYKLGIVSRISEKISKYLADIANDNYRLELTYMLYLNLSEVLSRYSLNTDIVKFYLEEAKKSLNDLFMRNVIDRDSYQRELAKINEIDAYLSLREGNLERATELYLKAIDLINNITLKSIKDEVHELILKSKLLTIKFILDEDVHDEIEKVVLRAIKMCRELSSSQLSGIVKNYIITSCIKGKVKNDLYNYVQVPWINILTQAYHWSMYRLGIVSVEPPLKLDYIMDSLRKIQSRESYTHIGYVSSLMYSILKNDIDNVRGIVKDMLRNYNLQYNATLMNIIGEMDGKLGVEINLEFLKSIAKLLICP